VDNDESDRTLGDLGEFGVIDRLTRGRPGSADVVVGPGDDGAVIAAGDYTGFLYQQTQHQSAQHPALQLLADGYDVCWKLWNAHASANQVAAGLVHDYPTLTSDEAAHFVTAAYDNLCPVPGAYDYWAYSTS